MDMAADRWLTRAEVAERLQVSAKTLAQWASAKDGQRGPRYARFGKHVRYRLADVIDWEGEQMVKRQSVRPSVTVTEGGGVTDGETVS